jgi:hypothetical protein
MRKNTFVLGLLFLGAFIIFGLSGVSACYDCGTYSYSTSYHKTYENDGSYRSYSVTTNPQSYVEKSRTVQKSYPYYYSSYHGSPSYYSYGYSYPRTYVSYNPGYYSYRSYPSYRVGYSHGSYGYAPSYHKSYDYWQRGYSPPRQVSGYVYKSYR